LGGLFSFTSGLKVDLVLFLSYFCKVYRRLYVLINAA